MHKERIGFPMQLDFTTDKINQIPVKDGIVVLSGYGVMANVEKGYLVLKDGLGIKSRESRFFKATCKIKRLVIHSTHGMVSLAALKWLNEINAGVVQLGWDGEVILASTPSQDNINLKRAQYSALYDDKGLILTKYLLLEKVNGQLKVLRTLAPDATYTYNGETINSLYFMKNLCTDIAKAKSISRVLEIESLAANLYWSVLSKMTLQFHQKGEFEVPEHWKTFGSRHSLINPKLNRNAINPANAMLNYLYALLYTETRLALLRVGLDPTAGIFHADNKYRDSFAYDVLEAVRSDVDVWLLNFVRNHVFSVKDFYEKRDGGIRLTLKIIPFLAETVSLWAKKIESVIGRIRLILVENESFDK